MATHISKRRVFMGGRLIQGGTPVEKSLIPDVFLKHFEGFDDAGKAIKVVVRSAEDQAKDKLEQDCLALYNVNLDRRKKLADMKLDYEAAKSSYEAKVIEESKARIKAEEDKAKKFK